MGTETPTIIMNGKEIKDYTKEQNNYYVNTENITNTIVFKFNKTITSAYRLFAGCISIIYLDLNNLNSSSINDMSGMFDYCLSLSSIYFGNFDNGQFIFWMLVFSLN